MPPFVLFPAGGGKEADVTGKEDCMLEGRDVTMFIYVSLSDTYRSPELSLVLLGFCVLPLVLLGLHCHIVPGFFYRFSMNCHWSYKACKSVPLHNLILLGFCGLTFVLLGLQKYTHRCLCLFCWDSLV